MNKLKRQFSGEVKVKILKRHLVGREEVSDICDELKINPNQFYRWQGEFFENGAAAFERHGKQEEAKMRKFREKIEALVQRVAYTS